MNILTVGAGVIGATYAWQLQKAGCRLTHLVRQHKVDLYTGQGILIRCLDLRTPGGKVIEERYHPRFVGDLSAADGFDCILVSVNSDQLTALLPYLASKAGRADIVFLQNMRLGDDELIARHLERDRYFLAYPFMAGGGRTGNVIQSVIFGMPFTDTVLGEVDGKTTPRVRALHRVLKKARMNPRIIPDIVPYIRTHYVWGACCLAARLKAGSYARFCQPDIIRESYMAMREGWEICARQGINPRRVSPTRYYYLPYFLLVPLTAWLYHRPGMREMFEGHIQHSPGEMRDMYFTLLALADQYGVEMPVYAAYREHVEAYFTGLRRPQGVENPAPQPGLA